MDQEAQKFWDTAFISFATAFFSNGQTTNDNSLSYNSFKAAIQDAATCADIAVECRTEKINQL